MEKEAAVFRALGDPTRLRIAVILAGRGETCVCHIAAALEAPDFKISRHLGVLRAAGLVSARREGTWMYYRFTPPPGALGEELSRLLTVGFEGNADAQTDQGRLGVSCCTPGGATARKLRVLFLCTGNSCRSQMAEGWARALKGDSIEAFSAGVERHGLNPDAVAVMREAGVDITGQRSKTVDELPPVDFDYVVTVCDNARESCPVFPARVRTVHRSFDDPPRLAREAASREAALDCYRRVRDEIRQFVQTLPGSLGG